MNRFFPGCIRKWMNMTRNTVIIGGRHMKGFSTAKDESCTDNQTREKP
jgi:hypothetical protein